MNIKKITAAFLLTLILTLSLSACKDDGKNTKKEEPEVSSTQSEKTPSKLPDSATTSQAHTTATLPTEIGDGWEGPPVPLP